MNEKTLTAQGKGKTFITLDAPDGKNRAWISKADKYGNFRINLSFDLMEGRMKIVDELDRLPYVSVLQVHNPHQECPGMVLRFTEPNPGCMALLTDDLSEILERYLSGSDAVSGQNNHILVKH